MCRRTALTAALPAAAILGGVAGERRQTGATGTRHARRYTFAPGAPRRATDRHQPACYPVARSFSRPTGYDAHLTTAHAAAVSASFPLQLACVVVRPVAIGGTGAVAAARVWTCRSAPPGRPRLLRGLAGETARSASRAGAAAPDTPAVECDHHCARAVWVSPFGVRRARRFYYGGGSG